MSRLETAFSRLSAALDVLEAAVHRRLSRERDTVAHADGLSRELMALKDDRDRLRQELDRLMAEKARLEGLNSEASVRIDRAIHQIRAVLTPRDMVQ